MHKIITVRTLQFLLTLKLQLEAGSQIQVRGNHILLTIEMHLDLLE